jgi:hypothetical protein
MINENVVGFLLLGFPFLDLIIDQSQPFVE